MLPGVGLGPYCFQDVAGVDDVPVVPAGEGIGDRWLATCYARLSSGRRGKRVFRMTSTSPARKATGNQPVSVQVRSVRAKLDGPWLPAAVTFSIELG